MYNGHLNTLYHVLHLTPYSGSVNVIYEPCHWFICFCAFIKVTVNVLDAIVVRKLSPSKLLCLPPNLIDVVCNK